MAATATTAGPSLGTALGLTDQPRVVTSASPPYAIVHTNKAWCEATGFTFLDVVGKTCTCLQGPATEGLALRELHAALAERQPCSSELVNYRRDGTPFRCRIRIEMVRGGSHWMGTLETVEPIEDGSVASLPRTAAEVAPRPPLAPVTYAEAGNAHGENACKRTRRADKVRLADVLAETTRPVVLCDKDFPHVITHPNQPWLEMCGYSLEEVEGLTNRILTGPETDGACIASLLQCVRRVEPSVQTVVNYKKGGVRFVNQVRTLPVYDEQDELAAFMSMLHEVDESHLEPVGGVGGGRSPNPNPGVAHLWTALQLKCEALVPLGGASGAAREEAVKALLTNHMAVLADMTNPAPSPSQPHLARVAAGVRPYADQALREVCRRLLGALHGAHHRGILDERLAPSHPLRAAQQLAWAEAADYLGSRIQTQPHASGRAADMSEAAGAAMRAVLREVADEARA